jgi:preprotein translocase subunit SecA
MIKHLKKFFPDFNEKEIKRYQEIVKEINKREEKFQKLSHPEIRMKTIEFKKRLSEWETIKDMEVEILATLKNACRRLTEIKHKYKRWEEEKIWNMIPYDVQLIWAMILNEWKVAEMKTWEWKTLVAALALYLNALEWKWAHLVTVNEYLAERDWTEMAQLFVFMGLSMWILKSWQSPEVKKAVYNTDVTYWTNNEFWFDYLRDNMVVVKELKTQRPLNFAIVDEVDSILIDEARTPLIISAPIDESIEKYWKYSELVKKLSKDWDFEIDEKAKNAVLTEDWVKHMEKLLWVENIYTENWFQEVHHIEQALKAQYMYEKDKDYLLIDWEVKIIDEFTWRIMSWRRFWQWLHQAIEAKEWVEIKKQSKTMASITFQNYFRMYKKLSWMTWTAKTEAEEFGSIYWLDTIWVPTNKPIKRKDLNDVIFLSEKWKFKAIAKKVKELNEKWQPVLVWTVSVEKSEKLSNLLKEHSIIHNVLNAKHHKDEAEIIANAWQKWAVTIATNMAWRWTDIKLWEWVKELWWLFILWSERHESRRIDNQLRWRSWRQWDVWTSQFFISLDDDLMRIFWWDKIKWMLSKIAKDEEEAIENSMITRSVEWAQKKVETHHFDTRKNIVKYDDVTNKHRSIIYDKRNKALNDKSIKTLTMQSIEDVVKNIIEKNTKDINQWEWNHPLMYWEIASISNEGIFTPEEWEKVKNIEWLEKMWIDYLKNAYKERSWKFEEEHWNAMEKAVFLQILDALWVEHLTNMDILRFQTDFAWYWQRDPLMEYKNEAFKKFIELNNNLKMNFLSVLYKTDIEIEKKEG